MKERRMKLVQKGHQLTQMLRFMTCSLLLLSCLSLPGCSETKKLVPVTGSVKVKGKWADGANVILHPEEAGIGNASGVTDDTGTFTLVSSLQEGVQPGKYRVTITWPDESKRKKEAFEQMGSNEDPPDQLKGRYASPKDTPLKAEIAADTTEIPAFELE